MTHFGHNDWGDTHFDHNDWSLERTVNFGSPGISYRVKCLCWPWSFPLKTFDKTDDKKQDLLPKSSMEKWRILAIAKLHPWFRGRRLEGKGGGGGVALHTKSWHLFWFVFISNISCQQLSSHYSFLYSFNVLQLAKRGDARNAIL